MIILAEKEKAGIFSKARCKHKPASAQLQRNDHGNMLYYEIAVVVSDAVQIRETRNCATVFLFPRRVEEQTESLISKKNVNSNVHLLHI